MRGPAWKNWEFEKECAFQTKRLEIGPRPAEGTDVHVHVHAVGFEEETPSYTYTPTVPRVDSFYNAGEVQIVISYLRSRVALLVPGHDAALHRVPWCVQCFSAMISTSVCC